MPITFRLDQILAERGEPTQAELARQAGLSANAVNEIALNKTSRISLATLEALCRALRVTPGEFFQWDHAAPTPAGRKSAARSARGVTK